MSEHAHSTARFDRAFANAVLLLVAMGSLLWEAAQRLQTPAPMEGVTIMAVAAIGVIVNGATAALFMAGRESDMNIRGAFLHMAADALLRTQKGVIDVHDLHVWAMSTTEVALTAHLVMPAGHPGDAYFTELAHELHEHFEITHPTLQIDLDCVDHGCKPPLGK